MIDILREESIPMTTPNHDRRRYIGGSDVAAVLGLSPWKTPLQLYEEKISETPPDPLSPEREKFFARRKRQEPVVAEMLYDEFGIEVTKLSLDGNPNRYADEDIPYLAAEIDFECLMTDRIYECFAASYPWLAQIPNGSTLNGEIKTVHPFKAGEWQDNEGYPDLPIHYAAQALHGMGVKRRPATIVAALIGLDGLLAFPVQRDDDTIAGMRAKCQTFWSHVTSRVAPAPSNLDEIKHLYRQFRGVRVELDDAAYALFCKRFEAKEAEAKAKLAAESAEYQFLQWVASAWGQPGAADPFTGADEERAILVYKGHQVGSWNRQRGAYLDQERLKIVHPTITKQFTNEHHYRVLRRKARPV